MKNLKNILIQLQNSPNYIYTDKGKSGYLDIYDEWFEPFQNKSDVKILEIGIKKGGSIILWSEYFEDVVVYGMDNDHGGQMKFDWQRAPDNVTVFDGNQANRDDLQLMVDNFQEFDIILDDGGHRMPQQQISFGFLFPYIKSGGLYIIEDLGTSTSVPYHIIEHEVKSDGSNTTVKMIEDFGKTGVINSEYMTEEEKTYLNNNILSYDMRVTGNKYHKNQTNIDFKTCGFYHK